MIVTTFFERDEAVDNIDNVEFLFDFVDLVIHKVILAQNLSVTSWHLPLKKGEVLSDKIGVWI